MGQPVKYVSNAIYRRKASFVHQIAILQYLDNVGQKGVIALVAISFSSVPCFHSCSHSFVKTLFGTLNMLLYFWSHCL